jgi:hypothetical protein
MDDKNSQAWANTLSDIRAKRLAAAANLYREKDGLKEFLAISRSSLDVVITKWWELESQSFPAGASESEIPSRIEEMSSIVDFEAEAIEADVNTFMASIAWNDATASDVLDHLSIAAEQIKQNYSYKIRNLLSEVAVPPLESGVLPPPPPEPSAPTPSMPASAMPGSVAAAPARLKKASGGSSSGSGFGLAIMFVIGLILGAGPSFYFWDASQKAQTSIQDKINRLSSEKRALEDNLSVYQDNLRKMAQGKLLTFPQLDEKMRPIREEIDQRRKKVEMDFNSKRESLMKKSPAGDRLDRAIEVLRERRDNQQADLDIEEKNRLEPYLKQMQLLREMAEK